MAEKCLLALWAEVAAAAQPLQVSQQQYWGWWLQKGSWHCISLSSFGGGQLCCICKMYSVVSALQSAVSVVNFFLLLMLARCSCKEGENIDLFFHLPALNFNHISHFMFPTAAALLPKQGTKDVLVVKPSSPTTFMMSTSCTRVILRTYDLMFFRKPSVLRWSLSSALWPWLLWGRRLPKSSSMIFLPFQSILCGKNPKTKQGRRKKKPVRAICLV